MYSKRLSADIHRDEGVVASMRENVLLFSISSLEFVFVLLCRSSFDDWRPHLGLLLQSIPFPDEALAHDRFIE